jgi:parvulin-like peptidyl-prolyl isomerase
MLNRVARAAFVLTCLVAVAPLRAEIIEQVLVKVNGDILTKTEFEQRQVTALRGRPELANVSASSLEIQKAISEATPDLILAAVDEMLLVQRGRELGYALGDEQFAQILGNLKKENKLEDDQRFQEALRQEGLTLADLRKNVEHSMLLNRVQQVDVMDKISVTEEESKAFYEAHRQEFTTPSELTLREILIEVPGSDKGVNVAQDDELREKAEDVRKRLLAGEPFPRLAAEVSTGASKANGGLIGPINHDELAPALQKMLDSMKVGDLTQVMRTQRGYQILKIESRTETKIKAFDDARDDISRRVAEQKSRGEMQKYLDRLREQASITWRNDELKKAYEQALAKRREAVPAVAAR